MAPRALTLRAVALACLAGAAGAARADASPPLPVLSMEAMAGVTNQAEGIDGTASRADALWMLRPRLTMARTGPVAWQLDASTTLTGSADGRAPLRASPAIDAALSAPLVAHLLEFDAAARVRPVQVDPFGPRLQADQSGNQRTEQSYHLGPALHARPWRGGLLQARYESLVTFDSAGTRDRLQGSRTEFTLAQLPTPLGASLSLSRLASRLHGTASSELVLQTARVGVDAAPDTDLIVGLDAGVDRTRTPTARRDDALWALHAGWRPSARLDVSALVESRFFGRGGQFVLRERMPWLSLAITAARRPTLVLQSDGGDAGDVRAALDAILTTRVPDRAERDTLVDALVSGLGVDTSGFAPADIRTTYPQVQSRAELALTLLAPRTSVSLVLYGRSDRVLRRRGEPLAAGVAVADDSRQRGLSLQASRLLSPVLSVDLLGRMARIEGLDAEAARRSTDSLLRAWFTRQLSRHASMTAGLQAQRLRSTETGAERTAAWLVFVGVADRF